MTSSSTPKTAVFTRRQAFNTAGKAIAGLVGMGALPSLEAMAAEAPQPQPPVGDANSTEKLRATSDTTRPATGW